MLDCFLDLSGLLCAGCIHSVKRKATIWRLSVYLSFCPIFSDVSASMRPAYVSTLLSEGSDTHVLCILEQVIRRVSRSCKVNAIVLRGIEYAESH